MVKELEDQYIIFGFAVVTAWLLLFSIEAMRRFKNNIKQGFLKNYAGYGEYIGEGKVSKEIDYLCHGDSPYSVYHSIYFLRKHV